MGATQYPAWKVKVLDVLREKHEQGLISEHLPYLKDKMNIDIQVSHQDTLLSSTHQRVAAEAEPRQPTLALDFGAVKKQGQTIETKKNTPIEDLKELNAHLSTRSYFEGGPKPSHADLAQFKVTPFNFSSKEFPHVGRWFRHIASFTATQTSKW